MRFEEIASETCKSCLLRTRLTFLPKELRQVWIFSLPLFESIQEGCITKDTYHRPEENLDWRELATTLRERPELQDI